MERDELAAWLRLTLTPGVGNASARKLLAAFGLPQAVFGQSATALRQVVSTTQAGALLAEPPELAAQLDATWQWLHEAAPGTRRRVLALGDADYPDSLLTIEDPPLMLYLLGAGNLEENQAVAHTGSAQSATHSIAMICGTAWPSSAAATRRRRALSNARQFARAFSEAGLTVISGLALGIDGEAHGRAGGRGVGGQRLATVAVVGTGLDRVYPKKHLELAHRIARSGLIISEFPIGTPPLAAELSQAQPHPGRTGAGHAGGGGGAAIGLADHRPARRRAGQGRVCHPRLDCLHPVARLPRADPAGRQAGRDGAGRA